MEVRKVYVCVENVFACDTSTWRDDAGERKETICSLLGPIEKVYERIWRTGLWMALEQYGVGGRLLRTIQHLYHDSKSAVRIGEEIKDWFEVERGV